VKSYSISKAQLSDIPVLKRIEIACGLSPWSIPAYESGLKQPTSVMLTAREDDGSIVGFLVGRAFLRADGEIQNIGTLSGSRRRGIGSALLNAFKEICRERQVSGIWLEVRSSNRSAIDFYRSHGFEKKGVRPKFYTDPVENAHLMYAVVT
jgi:[ribosomal protein S18]-alanine N-acetyltransferase